MNSYIIKEEKYQVSNWSGGKTRELALFPKGTTYLNRNFTWRLSSATCELDESKFTNLPDYNRVLMVLEGEVVLNYNGEKTVKLKELEQDSFDGAWKTNSFGKILDYNLMVKKGNEGYLDVLNLTGEAREETSTHKSERSLATHAIFVRDGYLIVGLNGNSQMVSKGELFVIEADEGEEISYTVMGEGVSIRAQIFYDLDGSEERPELIPNEKGTFSDFMSCLFIANTQFRGARFIFKKLQHTYYDEVIYNKIQKLERLCVTFFIFIIGAVAELLLTIKAGMSDMGVLVLLFAWLIIDATIISPLIYFFVLPKPIAKHVKDYRALSPYEQKVLEKRLSTNDRTERILKKYSGPKEKGKRK